MRRPPDGAAGDHRLDPVERRQEVVGGRDAGQLDLGALGLVRAVRTSRSRKPAAGRAVAMSQSLPGGASAPRSGGQAEVEGAVGDPLVLVSTPVEVAAGLATSVSSVPMVAAMVSSACTLNVSMASMVA